MMADIMPDSNLKERLRGRFVGQNLHHVQTPSIVLDLAKLKVNCGRMLEATRRLDLLWRVHIKTHKTTELTRIQVGDKLSAPVSIMTSTVAEAEGILPLLKEYQAKGRNVNVLLAFPLFPSAAVRLSRLSSELGPGTVSVMIDHPDQLSSASAIARAPGSHPPLVFLKIDAGYGRAGVVPSSTACAELIDAVLEAELAGSCVFHGVYCHAGHSYGLRKDWEAMHYLAAEFAGLHGVASYIRDRSPGHPLVLSVGATPTATTIQHPTFSGAASSGVDAPTREVETLFTELKATGFQLEVHAGV
jgi:D-serine ammonia-lyase